MKISRTIIIGFIFLCFGMTPLLADQDIHWSEQKEGLRIGVRHFSWPHTANGLLDLYVGKTTNYMDNLVLPEHDAERFECELRDASGRPVSKTKFGNQLGAKLETKITPSQKLRNLTLKAKLMDELEQFSFFKIDEVFEIPTDGEYELEIHPKMLKKEPEKLVPIVFSPIKFKIRLISNGDRSH